MFQDLIVNEEQEEQVHYNMSMEQELSLTNEIKDMKQESFKLLLTEVQNEFQKDLVNINQNYRLQIITLLEREQSVLVSQFQEKSQLLQWVQSKLNEIPSKFSEHEANIKNLLQKSHQQINLGCHAQKSLIVGLIDQIIKELETGILKDGKQKSIPQKFLIESTIPDNANNIQESQQRITCLFCMESQFETPTYRKHLRDLHQMTFMGYSCTDCGFVHRSVDEFSGHVKKVHGKRACVCGSIFLKKKEFCSHLRQCLRFFKASSSQQKSSTKQKTSKQQELLISTIEDKT